jgi:hypothetical protein
MAQYFIRVELKGYPSGENYENLHALMANNNWSQTVTGMSNGKSVLVNLPYATYQGTSDKGAFVRADALKTTIIDQVWKNPIVLAMVVTRWAQV